MQKRSHLKLSNKLLQINKDLNIKKKSLYFGSILPDCIPSFLYVRHNIDSSIKKIEKLIFKLEKSKKENIFFWIKVGCITHYIADYFTYPHTKSFDGGFLKHISYEKLLNKKFKINLDIIKTKDIKTFNSTKELILYIKKEQENYYKKIKNLTDKTLITVIDTEYIFNIVNTIFYNLLEKKGCLYE